MLDARLDAQEGKTDEAERREGARARAEAAQAVGHVRSQQLERRRQMAKEIRTLAMEKATAEMYAAGLVAAATAAASTEQPPSSPLQLKDGTAAIGAAVSGSLVAMARQRGDQQRDEAKQLTLERSKRELGYIERAKANRERALATRERARAAVAEALATRKRGANKERSNDHLVDDEKARILAANKKEVSTIYRARFASREAATEYEGSPWKGLAAAAAWFGKSGTGSQTHQRSTANDVAAMRAAAAQHQQMAV